MPCLAWLKAISATSAAVFIPEIAHYEVRRELIRIRAVGSLRRLEHSDFHYFLLPHARPVPVKGGRCGPSTLPECQIVGGPSALPLRALLVAGTSAVSISYGRGLRGTAPVPPVPLFAREFVSIR